MEDGRATNQIKRVICKGKVLRIHDAIIHARQALLRRTLSALLDRDLRDVNPGDEAAVPGHEGGVAVRATPVLQHPLVAAARTEVIFVKALTAVGALVKPFYTRPLPGLLLVRMVVKLLFPLLPVFRNDGLGGVLGHPTHLVLSTRVHASCPPAWVDSVLSTRPGLLSELLPFLGTA